VACYYRQQLTASQLSSVSLSCIVHAVSRSWTVLWRSTLRLQTMLPCWCYCPNGQAASVTDLTCSHSPTPCMHLQWMRHLRPIPKLKTSAAVEFQRPIILSTESTTATVRTSPIQAVASLCSRGSYPGGWIRLKNDLYNSSSKLDIHLKGRLAN
jgi:hypothetical protein